MKKVLIFEPHDYHYEILPGFIKYFQELDYQCDLLIQKNSITKGLFDCFGNSIHIMYYKHPDVKEYLRSEEISDYDFIFISSLEFFHDEKKERVLDYLGFQPKTKYGLLGVYHNIDMINIKLDKDLLLENRIFLLTGRQFHGFEIHTLNPHYFGEFSYFHNSQEKIIISIGMSNDLYLILHEIEKIISKDKNLSFKVMFVGKYNKMQIFIKNLCLQLIYLFDFTKKYSYLTKNKFSYKTRKYIKFLGSLSFSDMYNEINKADCILIALNKDTAYGKKFLYGKTTGSKQISLGLQKISIISDDFKDSFGFSIENSYIYKHNDICEGVQEFLMSSQDEYEEKRQKLIELQEKIYKESKENLYYTISKIEKIYRKELS